MLQLDESRFCSLATSSLVAPSSLRLHRSFRYCTMCTLPHQPTYFFSQVHMLPESSETLDEQWGDAIPWGGLIASVGFISVSVLCQRSSRSVLCTFIDTIMQEGRRMTTVKTIQRLTWSDATPRSSLLAISCWDTGLV